MDRPYRAAFNAAFNESLYQRFLTRFQEVVGPIEFRVAETPFFVSHELRDRLANHAREIVAELALPHNLATMKTAIPAAYAVPGMDELPNCVQVDFAVVEGPDGKLDGKVVELQAFPSLYALMTSQAEVWAEFFRDIPGLGGDWTWAISGTHEQGYDLMRRTILGDADPEHTVLVDIDPETQKTSPDFVATRNRVGIDTVCITKIIKRGRKLYRMKNGREVPIDRIYNRMVFDELEVKKAPVPFRWNDELDISWCSHPNWYWVWSKFSLPHLRHQAIPGSRYLDQVTDPGDLSQKVLKPLFSFAGSGVKIDVTPEDLAAVPPDQRHGWVLQDKIRYAEAIRMPDGNGVKAEVRVMLLRPPGSRELTPLIDLVRLSRGKMHGVDHNKGLTWVGGSVGMWPR